MTAVLLIKLAPYLAACLALVAAVWRLIAKTKKQARQETALEAADRYAKTRKAMDDVESIDDAGVLREWLRQRDSGVK